MKYTILLALLFISFAVVPQENLIGIKLGLGKTKKFERPKNVQPKVGSHFGVTYENRSKSKFSFITEIIHLSRKFNYSFNYTAINGSLESADIDIKLNYIEVPLKLGLWLNESRTVRVKLGMVISVLYQDKIQENSSSNYTVVLGSGTEGSQLKGVGEMEIMLRELQDFELYTVLGGQFGIRPMYDFNHRAPHAPSHISFDLSIGCRFEI